jgi:eukaryotic-like serine/threonine-protein kinase
MARARPASPVGTRGTLESLAASDLSDGSSLLTTSRNRRGGLLIGPPMSEVRPPQASPNPGPIGIAQDPFEGTPYRAVARLSSGAMGEVFLVERTKLGQRFAAKLLHANLAADPQLLERMRLEAESLSRLEHPNIVAAFDFLLTRDNRPFVVMEYLKGRTLDDDIAIRGPMPPEEALDFASQLLAALQAAHELGIVHRDIKPSNLFLCDAVHGARQLKVLDFGVVRVLPNAPPHAPDPSAIPTVTGILVGTPGYLSPEGATGKKVDVRADLYAAALMLYIVLTGRGPFDDLGHDSMTPTASAFMEARAPSRMASIAIDSELDAIVLKGLSKNPDERYQTAVEFKRVIDRHRATLRSSTQVLDAGLGNPRSEDSTSEAPALPLTSSHRVTPVGFLLGAATRWFRRRFHPRFAFLQRRNAR